MLTELFRVNYVLSLFKDRGRFDVTTFLQWLIRRFHLLQSQRPCGNPSPLSKRLWALSHPQKFVQYILIQVQIKQVQA